jgi:hypothetical protein
MKQKGCEDGNLSPHPLGDSMVGSLTERAASAMSQLGIVGTLQRKLSSIFGKGWPEVERKYEFPGGHITLDFLSYVKGEAKDFARRSAELSYLWGIDLTRSEVKLEEWKYFFLCLSDAVIPQIKNATVWILDDWVNSAKPAFDSDTLLLDIFPRRLKVRIRQALARCKTLPSGDRRPLDEQRLHTVVQGWKKSLMPMKPTGVVANLQKHAKVLSGIDQPLEEEVRDVIERVCEVLIVPKISKVPTVSSSISIKSTIESNFKNGGMLGFIRKDAGLGLLPRAPEFLGYLYEYEKDYLPVPCYSSLSMHVADMHSMMADYRRLNLTKNPTSRPYAILEPLKARIITKPNVTQYMGLKVIQKKTWEMLSHFDQFSLIGQPISSWFLAYLDFFKDDSERWISGDYEAATDNLNMEVTLLIARYIYSRQDPAVFELIKRALMGSDFCYDVSQASPRYEDVPTFDNYLSRCEPISFTQTRGQLMGSILSFPILCIANYCAFHLAMERREGHQLFPFGARIKKVFINGDDILFTADEKTYSIWLETIKLFGFKPSVGKNLSSPDYAQINSCIYKMVPGDLPEVIPFVNMGIYCGRRKQDCSFDATVSSKERSMVRFTSIQTLFREARYPGLHHNLDARVRVLWNFHNSRIERLFKVSGLLETSLDVEGRIRKCVFDRDPLQWERLAFSKQFPEHRLFFPESDTELSYAKMRLRAKRLTKIPLAEKKESTNLREDWFPSPTSTPFFWRDERCGAHGATSYANSRGCGAVGTVQNLSIIDLTSDPSFNSPLIQWSTTSSTRMVAEIRARLALDQLAALQLREKELWEVEAKANQNDFPVV